MASKYGCSDLFEIDVPNLSRTITDPWRIQNENMQDKHTLFDCNWNDDVITNCSWDSIEIQAVKRNSLHSNKHDDFRLDLTEFDPFSRQTTYNTKEITFKGGTCNPKTQDNGFRPIPKPRWSLLNKKKESGESTGLNMPSTLLIPDPVKTKDEKFGWQFKYLSTPISKYEISNKFETDNAHFKEHNRNLTKDGYKTGFETFSVNDEFIWNKTLSKNPYWKEIENTNDFPRNESLFTKSSLNKNESKDVRSLCLEAMQIDDEPQNKFQVKGSILQKEYCKPDISEYTWQGDGLDTEPEKQIWSERKPKKIFNFSQGKKTSSNCYTNTDCPQEYPKFGAYPLHPKQFDIPVLHQSDIEKAMVYLKENCGVIESGLLDNILELMVCPASSNSKMDELSVKDIVNYVNNSQESCHQFGLSIQNIVLLKQKQEANFDEFCLNEGILGGRRMYLWHGTEMKNLGRILKNGFQLPKFGVGARRLQGQGLYFADRVTKSAQYCESKGRTQNPKVGGNGILLLCEVLLGNVYYATGPDNGRNECPFNYHSVACQGELIPNPKENILVGGATLPLGKSVQCPKKPPYRLKFNEYIVYSNNQVKIRAIVHFNFTSKKCQN